jgi:hypothetical protein
MGPKPQPSFPGPAGSTRKPQYLRNFRQATYILYRPQESLPKFPQTNPAAAYRRAFVLTLFSVFMTEATETERLKEKFSTVFPILRLPFRGVIASDVKREYLGAFDLKADETAPRLTKIQETRAGIKHGFLLHSYDCLS